MSNYKPRIRVGADVGGTFTDVVLIDDDGMIRAHKVPSTPPNFHEAVLDAVNHLMEISAVPGSAISEVVHGTTVATNAVLERHGARTALVTTKGFRDVLELRRIRETEMYNLFFEKPTELVERHLRFEVPERIGADGQVLKSIAQMDLQKLKETLEKENVESIAVCFLHAYAFPQNEEIVGRFLRSELPEVPVSLSSEVLRERGEYERTATTVVNAYVRPIMRGYIGRMHDGLENIGINSPLLMMQSSGGLTTDEDAGTRPVFVLESGPAAGVLASSHVAERIGIGNVITLDMGGTTSKSSLINDGSVGYSPEYEVGSSMSSGNRLMGGGGELIRAPTIDIAEVGAGGGSIASVDRGNALHVGPRSAGAMPGPACYRRGGTEATVTDANVVLGYIRHGTLAGGDVTIDLESALQVINDRVALPLDLSVLEAAAGIHRIANARTMRALRAVSTERGRDPRNYILMAFGGAGPIHAVGLGMELGISQIVIPPVPGLFSALGLLVSDIEHHDVRSCHLSGKELTIHQLLQIRNDMLNQILAQLVGEGYSEDNIEWITHVDIRFQGQTSEIRIPLPKLSPNDIALSTLIESFMSEHERLYGHRSDPSNPVEVVAVRLVGRVQRHTNEIKLRHAETKSQTAKSRHALFEGNATAIETPVISRADLSEREAVGPFLIDEYDSTIVVPPKARVRLDHDGNVIIMVNDS